MNYIIDRGVFNPKPSENMLEFNGRDLDFSFIQINLIFCLFTKEYRYKFIFFSCVYQNVSACSVNLAPTRVPISLSHRSPAQWSALSGK